MLDLPKSYRIDICIDGVKFMGMSTTADLKDEKQQLEFFKELVQMLEAPDLPDPEVLGKYSPEETK